MLTEIHSVTQERGTSIRRRWFQDEGMELIVWYRGEATDGFQICYSNGTNRERALTWRVGGNFSHARVDQGDSRAGSDLTPILVRDGPVPWDWINAEFAKRSSQLEPAVREFVLTALAGSKR